MKKTSNAKNNGEENAMRLISIYNPAAGKGKKKKSVSLPQKTPGMSSHVTSRINDAREYIRRECLADPDTLFTVYGGDGTLCEAANGIVSSGRADSAILSVYPCGSGNDFVRNFPSDRQKEYPIDLIDLGDMVGVNIVNIGFDCSVVARSETLRSKKIVPGGFSYLLGVLAVLAGNFGIRLDVELTREDGSVEKYDGEFLLCVIANGGYYGGGFHAAPAAKTDDGLLDVMLVRRVSRVRFLSLLSDYKSGGHIDLDTLTPKEKFKDLMIYKRCVSVKVGGMNEICVDGEVLPKTSISASALPRTLRFLYPYDAALSAGAGGAPNPTKESDKPE